MKLGAGSSLREIVADTLYNVVREHTRAAVPEAALKPRDQGLMLELMHYPEDLRAPSDFKVPAKKTPAKVAAKREEARATTVRLTPVEATDGRNRATVVVRVDSIDQLDEALRLAAAEEKLREQTEYLERLRHDPALVERIIRQKLGYAKDDEYIFRFEEPKP